MENTNDKTAVQMPEPERYNEDGFLVLGYTSKQMQEYGDARAEEARREAASAIANHTAYIAELEAKIAQRTAGGDAVAHLEFDGYHDSDEHHGKTILDLVRSRLEVDPDDLAAGDVFYVNAVLVQPQEWRVARSGNPFEVERISPPAAQPVAEPSPSAAGGDVMRWQDRQRDGTARSDQRAMEDEIAEWRALAAQPVAEAAAQADEVPIDDELRVRAMFNEWYGVPQEPESPQQAAIAYWAQQAFIAGASLSPTAAPTAQPTPPYDERAARNQAWGALHADLADGTWTTAESATYHGFFLHGWQARAALRQPGANTGGSGGGKSPHAGEIRTLVGTPRPWPGEAWSDTTVPVAAEKLPTQEQVEKYIEFADAELGPECCDAWVEWCRSTLRAALAAKQAGKEG